MPWSKVRSFPFALVLVLAAPLPALARQQEQQPPPQQQQQQAVVQVSQDEASRTFHDLLTRYYDAYRRKDLAALEALWHPKGPARYARNMAEVEFERRSVTLTGLMLRDIRVDAGGGRARVVADLDVTDAQTKQTQHERRVREFTFLQDGDTWKIWNEGAAGAGIQVAARLMETPAAERAALIASDPEVRSDDTLAALGRQANTQRGLGKLSETLETLRVQADLARALRNDRVLAGSLLDAGLIWQVLGRQEEAGRAFADARELFARFGTKSEVAVIDGNLASVDYLRGNYADAAERYRAALAVFDAEDDAPHVASTLHSLGNALYMQGDFEQAMTSYERSLGMQQQAVNRVGASSVLQAIALVHKELGNYGAAIDAYARSASLSGEAADWVGAARAEHGLGEISRLVGDYPTALQHFSAAIALWEKTPDTTNLAGTRFAAGQVWVLQRSLARGIEWYQSALELDQKQGDQAGIARDLGGLGGAHFAQGRLDLALDEYKKSLAIREALKDVPGTMWTVVHIGVLYGALGRHGEALEAYQRALTIAEPQGDAGAVATILALRAANELAREDVDAALASSAKAAEAAARLELFDVLSAARLTAGKAHRGAGRPSDARAAFEEAIAAMERVPVGPGVETFFDDRRSPYLALIDLLVEQNLPAEAFAWSERARTSALAMMLGGDGSVVVKGLTAEERDEERRLARAGKTLAVKLRRERARAKPDAERQAALQHDLQQAHDGLDAFRRTLFEKHPLVSALRAQAEPASLASAGGILTPPEVLVSFVVTDTRTHLFLVSRSSTASAGATAKVVTIDVKAAELAARVNAVREAIRGRQPEAAKLSRELHNLLLDAARDSLSSARSLVIVPDAFLWSLPFEALRNSAGRYVAQDYAVSYAPSLTALATMRTAGAIADVAPKAGAAAVPAPRRPLLVAAADPALSRSAEERLALLRAADAPPVASAAREVRALSVLFGPASSRLLLRDQARADRLTGALRTSSILHLAVPACLAEASPLYSLVALAPTGSDRDQEGLIDPVDIMSWTAPADLAVLSRLEHSAGATGESLTALAWSLFIAGAPSTLVTRWAPPPAGATKALSAFYRAWLASPRGSRPSPGVSLQKAVRALIAEPGSQPADWAGLMVLGR